MPESWSLRDTMLRAAAPGLRTLGRARVGPSRQLVIYCPPRVGSDLLVSLLDGHPDVRCEGELLATGRPAPLQWFDARTALAASRGHQVWGAKIITSHLTWFAASYGPAPEVLRALVDRGYTIVSIRRRDWLLQALSLVHASATKYHFTTADAHRFTKMTVDPVHVAHCLYAIEEEDRAAVHALDGLPHLELWYEDDLRSPERQAATLDRLCDVLHIPRIEAHTDVVPGAPPTLEERVENLDELITLVGQTRYARFLGSALSRVC